MLSRIDLYVMRQIGMPFVMTLMVAAMLLLMEKMVRLFDFVVNENGPATVVWKMLANLIPHYMGLALPIGLFLGVLLGFRKLSLSSELDAMTGTGAGIPRLMRPVLLFALLLATFNLVLVGYIQPFSRYAYRDLEFDLRSGALGASIKVGDFVTIADEVVLRIDESRDGGRELGGVFLQRQSDNGNQIVVTAERGAFFASQDQQTIILRLYTGRMIDLNITQNKPRVLTFDTQDIALTLPDFEEFRERGGEQLELTLDELIARVRQPLPPDASPAERELDQASLANLHWRILHSLSFLVLPFMAVAMGVSNKRTGSALGLVVGLSMVIIYHEILESSERAVELGKASPWVAMWGLFGTFSLLSLHFYRIIAFKPGGDPLSWLQRLWALIKAPIMRLTDRLERAL